MSGPGLRRVLHVASAGVLLGALLPVQTFRLLVIGTAIAASVSEMIRLRAPRVAGWLAAVVPVFRATERDRPSGAFWLALGYSVAVWVPMPAPFVGILCAAVADPAASLAGSRWGKGARKSWPGSLAAAAVAAGVAALVVGFGGFSLPWRVVPAAAVATAALERWSGPFDDNVIVAPGVAVTAWVLA